MVSSLPPNKIHDDFGDTLISQFECLTPDFTNSQHMFIIVSEFLCKKSNESIFWKDLLENIGFPIYSYKRNSKSILKLSAEFGFDLFKNNWRSCLGFLADFYNKNSSGFLNRLNIVVEGTDGIINGYDKTLNKAINKTIESAQISGVLLAHSLMLQFPFRGKSISLVGFSLGTQVIYSCLEELK